MVEDYFNIEKMGVRIAPPIQSEDDIRANRILHESTKHFGKRFETDLLWKTHLANLPALNRIK